MKERKWIMLRLVFILIISFWMIGAGQKAALGAQETGPEEKGKKKTQVPRVEDLKPILKKILPRATEFRKSKKELCKECLACYLCFHQEEKVGVISFFTVEGQWGPMFIMIGVNMEKKITRIELSYHTETPGCGSQVDRRPFLEQFEGKMVKDPLKIYKDLLEATDAVKGVDCITRATVSSKAVAKGIKKRLKIIVEQYLNGKEDAWK